MKILKKIYKVTYMLNLESNFFIKWRKYKTTNESNGGKQHLKVFSWRINANDGGALY